MTKTYSFLESWLSGYIGQNLVPKMAKISLLKKKIAKTKRKQEK